MKKTIFASLVALVCSECSSTQNINKTPVAALDLDTSKLIWVKQK